MNEPRAAAAGASARGASARNTRVLVGAALGAALVLLSAASHADETKPGEDEARSHFAAGVNLVRDPAGPRYEEAYVEFKRAYAIAASPKILGNLGLCAMKLERDSEAIDAYSRYLAEVPDLAPEERAQVERDISTLKATLATITVDVRGPTTPTGGVASVMIVDTRIPTHGDNVTNTHGPITTATPIGLRRGHHVLKARFDSGAEAVWEADIAGGESHTFEAPVAAPLVVVAPPVKEPARRPIPSTVYIAGGASIALGLGGLITGLVAVEKRSDFDAKNDGTDPSAANDLRSTGTTLNVVSDVLFVGALVGVGVTTYLYLTRPTSRSTSAAFAPTLLRF